MTEKDFDKLLERRLEKIKKILASKGEEYASNFDRLHNFKVAAAASEVTPPVALWGMAMKHYVSVQDIVYGRLPNTKEMVDEKVGDLINYLILLEAVLEDERRVNSGT